MTRRRPMLAVVLGLAVVGFLVGGALRPSSATVPPTLVRAVATVELDDVGLDPLPVGVLRIDVLNRDDRQLQVISARVAGAGVEGQITRRVDTRVAPGQRLRLPITVPLRCGRLMDDSGPPQVQLTLAPPDQPPSPVAAAVTGPAAGSGLCAAASARLPAGWSAPLLLRGVSLTPTLLTLRMAGVPDGRRIVAVRADQWQLPLLGAPAPTPDGVVTVGARPPATRCAGLAPPRLPAGVQVVLADPDDDQLVMYLPVGAALAGWLSAAWGRACPQRPAEVGGAR